MAITAGMIFGRGVEPNLRRAHANPPGIVRLEPTNARELRDQLVGFFERTGNGEITSQDFSAGFNRNLPKSALIASPGRDPLFVVGPEEVSRLAALAADKVREGKGSEWFAPSELHASRTEAITAEIGRNWDRLVRRSDTVASMVEALEGKGFTTGPLRVFAPEGDPVALRRLRAEAKAIRSQGGREVEVRAFPQHVDAAFLKTLNEVPGMAYLPKPFVVPGGIFNEMFNWDSVFIAEQGLLATGRPEHVELAKGIVENFAYSLEHYGKIPNSNFSFLMSRTQPPLMPRLALAVQKVRPDAVFLKRVAEAGLKELNQVWRSSPRVTPSGLSRYHDDGEGDLPEIDKSLYSDFPDLLAFYTHERSIRESGRDDTHQCGLEAHHYESLELNSMLYRYETDLAKMFRSVEGPSSLQAARLEEEAAARAKTMQERFWDEGRGLFFDYNFKRNERSTYITISTFAPLADGWATESQSQRVAANSGYFLEKGGLTISAKACMEAAGGDSYQWEHPFTWGNENTRADQGLRRFDRHALADEASYRWLFMVLKTWGEGNGLLKEKYDAVRASPEVTVEYGNQGNSRGSLTAQEPTPMGFGWTNSSVVGLLESLPAELRLKLDQGIAPERVFPHRKAR